MRCLHLFRTAIASACLVLVPVAAFTCEDAPAETTKHDMVIKGNVAATRSLTVSPSLGERIKRALDPESKETVRLEIDGVRPPAQALADGKLYGLRVFVNKPDASPRTPDTDPHYAGAVAFAPTGNTREPEGFLLDITPVLSKLAKRDSLSLDKPVEVTIVPDGEEDSLTAALQIPVEKVQISVKQVDPQAP